MTDVVTHVDDPLALGSDTSARVRTRQGGAGGNVAQWLAALGISVAFVGRVGDDLFGREAVQVLAAAGVSTHVTTTPGLATGACVVLVGRDGERTMLPDAGANSALAVADLPPGILGGAGRLHVSGYTLLNPGSRAAGQLALRSARSAGVPTSVDAASCAPLQAVGAQEFIALTRDVDLMLCTVDEAEVLCDSRDPEVASARLTAHYREVVLKLGPLGAMWCSADRRTTCRVPAARPPGEVLDTTGAGDAFAAAFLAATLRGEDVEAALGAGCRLGALVTTRDEARP